MRGSSLLLLLPLIASLSGPSPAAAAIELGRGGGDKVVLQETYQREGVAFVAVDEVLATVGLSGQWDNVDHVYRITTKQGTAIISPGSDYLRYGDRAVRVSHRPRFIDGKLRVSEDFLAGQLIPALDLALEVSNLDPAAPPPESPLDQLFSLFLQQRPRAVADSEWVVAIDPGHGGQDAGALGPDGVTEQTVNLGVALQLQRLLKMRRAAPVVMTRDADYAVTPAQRLEAVGRGRADVLLTLHAQTFAAPAVQGVTLFVAPPRSAVPVSGANAETVAPVAPGVNASLRLAESLHAALRAGGFPVAPIQERALLPLGEGDLPRVMVEMGFLSNAADFAALRDAAGQQRLARALYDGLESFLKNYQNLQEASSEPGKTSAQP